MAILAAVSALSTFYQNSLIQAIRGKSRFRSTTVTKLPTIAAYSYKKSVGQPLIYPRNTMSYCANFLQMMFGIPCEDYELDQDFVEALEFAAHRPCRSRTELQHEHGADGGLFQRESVCLYFRRHLCAVGAAARWTNEAVVLMLERIIADGCNVPKLVDMAKDKKSDFRLMGFGHRVYRNFDPRCLIIKKACDKLLGKLKIRDPLFDVAQQLEEVAHERSVLHRTEALSER